jgi:hypothetical protein
MIQRLSALLCDATSLAENDLDMVYADNAGCEGGREVEEYGEDRMANEEDTRRDKSLAVIH